LNKFAFLAAIVLTFIGTFSSTPASAQFLRTFVSGLGSDLNPCTRTQPCQTFAHAITQTNAGGEIDVLDPGGYGPFTIGKSISIVNDGVGTAGVKAAAGGIAITITAGATDTINLRGLTIEGAGVGLVGIHFLSGKSLTVQNCIVRNFTIDGIHFLPSAASSLSVSNTFVASNAGNGISVLPSGAGAITADFNRVETGNNGQSGILVQPTGSGAVAAIFNQVAADNNAGGGIDLSGGLSTGTISATVADSVASNSATPGTAGVSASTDMSHAPINLLVLRSVAANNNAGIAANGTGATVLIGQSAMHGNTNGWFAGSGGVLQSYGDNKINGNTANETSPPAVTGGGK